MENAKRHTGLSVLIVLLILSNSFGAYKLLTDTDKFVGIYQSFSLAVIRSMAIIPFITIISLLAIWFGKSWGIWITILAFLIVLFLDIYFKVWYHAVIALFSFMLLMGFCWSSRNFFRK